MDIYQEDLAFIQATGFGDFARAVAPEIVRLLQACETPVRRVIEAGCGAGPLSAALVNAGFEVTGVDVSAELLTLARMACPEARFIHGSLYDQELPPCEAVLAVGEPLTYHQGDAAENRVYDFFQRSADALPSGGMLIFDLIELGQQSLAGRFWKAGEDWAVLSETQEDPSERTLIRTIETFRKVGDFYRRSHEVHHVRLFDREEVCQWLREAGFTVETSQQYGTYKLVSRQRAFFCTRRSKSPL